MMNRYLQSGCWLAGALMLALSAGCAGSPKPTGSSGHLPGWPAMEPDGGTNAPVLTETVSADAGGELRGAGTLTGAAPDTFQEFWRDPEFVKRFMGGYGFQAEIEPKFQSPEEQAFYRELAPIVGEQPEEAVGRLRAFLKPDSSALLNHLLGRLHLQLGDAGNAATQFELAVARFPDFRRAHKDLGFLHVREGRFEEAVRHLTRVIELGGADGNTFGLLGVAHLNQRKHLSAETAYRNAILYSPAVADWKLGLIKSLIEQGKYDESLALLDELLIENPGNERLWSIQGSVLLQKDEPARAAVNFEVLRKLGKADVKTMMLLGDIHLSREARALALEVYLEAMGKGGAEQLEATLRAAEVFTSLGAWEEARELFAKARDVGSEEMPDETRLRLLKLESKVALATGAGEEALRVLEEIIESNPLDGEALMLVGDYYAGIGEREMAELRFERAAKLEGFEADACVKHAQLLVQHQQYPKAIELLHRAQKLKPRDNIQRFLEAVERIAGSSSASNPVNS